MSNNIEQKEVQKETTTEESIEPPEMVGMPVVSLMEDLKESPQNALETLAQLILEILHSLGIYRHVTITFDPDNVDNPLHTSIAISEPLKKEWGDNKVKEFINEFYEYAMNTFASSRLSAEGKIIDNAVIAVNEAAYYVAGLYHFDLFIKFPYDSSPKDINAERLVWILVKK